MPWRRRLTPIVRPLYRLYARFSRGMTLGVRGLVLNDAGEVLLVEHTYTAGWHLPGGGVEMGETTEAALARELVEEAGVQVEGRPQLVAVHANPGTFRGDHVVLYLVESWTPCQATSRGEILRVGWFAPEALPDGVTGPTLRRIAEGLAGRS